MPAQEDQPTNGAEDVQHATEQIDRRIAADQDNAALIESADPDTEFRPHADPGADSDTESHEDAEQTAKTSRRQLDAMAARGTSETSRDR